jgi:hypothetical protein
MNRWLAVHAVKHYAETHLAHDETFFDFTNRGLLFFLLDRDNPIRYSEVGFYSRDKQQWRVIRALRDNPKVKAALMPSVYGGQAVDNVPNERRAPLVYQWLQENFEPHVQEGDVVIWRRKESQSRKVTESQSRQLRSCVLHADYEALRLSDFATNLARAWIAHASSCTSPRNIHSRQRSS